MSKDKFIENHFFRPRWYSIIINPYFLVRKYLYEGVKDFSKSLKKDDRVLDVGCGLKPYKEFFSNQTYIGVDIEGGGHDDAKKEVDFFYNGKDLPFDDEEFDGIICTEVLEHAEDPNKVIGEMYRTLKPGGLLFITVPFVYNEHETPYDFRRMTRFELSRILKNSRFSVDQIISTTGVFRTCGQLLSAFFFEIIRIRSTILKSLISVLICFPIQFIALIIDKIIPNKWITLNYIVYAHKEK